MKNYFRAKKSICFALTLAAALVAHAESIKLVAWNAEWFPGGKPDATPEEAKASMALAQDVLRQINPDIFIGEEIHDFSAFQELTSAVTNLEVGTVSAFRVRETGLLAHQQVGIAAKLPIQAAWAESWQTPIPAVPRGFSFAAIENPKTGKLILVYGVHLKSNLTAGRGDYQAALNSLWRDESVDQLLKHIDDMERVTFKGQIQGIVVAGDFNTNEDGQFKDHVVKMLIEHGFHNSWESVTADKRATWRGEGDLKPTTFDYIFTKGLRKPQAAMIPIPDKASDHCPITITIQ